MTSPASLHLLLTTFFLVTQSLPLLFTPSLLVTLLSPAPARAPTPLETHFARSLGLTLLFLALYTLLTAGFFHDNSSSYSFRPSDQPLNDPDASTGETGVEARSQIASGGLLIMTGYQTALGIHCYLRYMDTDKGQAGFGVAGVGYGFLVGVGVWAMVFGGEGRSRGSGWMSKGHRTKVGKKSVRRD